MDFGRAGSPYALPAAFTGTGASNGDATRPQYAWRTLRRFGGWRRWSAQVLSDTAQGGGRAVPWSRRPSRWAKMPNSVVYRDEKCERHDEHWDGELSTRMREDIYGQAPPRSPTPATPRTSSTSRPRSSPNTCAMTFLPTAFVGAPPKTATSPCACYSSVAARCPTPALPPPTHGSSSTRRQWHTPSPRS